MPQRRKIVLLFGLGIVLPSLLLGYLAFRGIQNDRALVEKQRLEGIRLASEQVVRRVDERIAAVEKALSRAADGLSGLLTAEALTRLAQFAGGEPLIEQIFFLDPGRTLEFPSGGLPYVRDGSRGPGDLSSRELSRSSDYQAGQRLEFRQSDLPAALAAYRRALARAKDDPMATGLILNAVARVQKKSGAPREAVSTYETIVREYGWAVIPGGMPLGPAAALEICALSQDLRDFRTSLQTALDLIRSLLRKEWPVEKAEFEFFAGRARDHVASLLSEAPGGVDLEAFRSAFQALAGEETAARNRAARMLAFQEGAVPALEARRGTAAGPEAPEPRFVRAALDIGGAAYLISVYGPASPAGEKAAGAWGFIVDAERLLRDVLGPALRELVPSAEAAWTVKGRDGTDLMSSDGPLSGPAAFRANFTSNLPDWALEFHQAPPRLIRTFLLSRRGFYFFVFLLIAGILVFGLILTIRSISHELALARMKSDFVSTVSHEFKSPLTSIRQLAEMLQSGRVPSDERRQKYYDILLEQSERLALLTDNILSLARIEEGRADLEFEATNIADLLTSTVSSFQERVRHEGFTIDLEIAEALPPLEADRTALSQAVTNLLDNAVKYSGSSRAISVRAFIQRPFLLIAVQDRGVGIRKGDLDRVFERFYRAGDELTRTVKGSGLGLTLVKEIIEAHRGKIEVESEPGKGSLFTIRLPLPPGKGDRT